MEDSKRLKQGFDQNKTEITHKEQPKIDPLPKDQGPGPQYSPPGFLRSRPMGTRQVVELSFKEQQEQYKQEQFKAVEQQAKDLPPADRRDFISQARERYYPNPYNRMSASEKDAAKTESRDIERSQEYMDAKLSKQNKTPEQQTLPGVEEKGSNKPVELGKSSAPESKMSQRFTQSLSYTKAVEKSDHVKPDKTPEPSKD